MRAAILSGQTVVNTIELDDKENPVEWGAVRCPDGVGINWTYDGVNWNPPPEPTPDMASVKAMAKQKLREQIDAIMNPIREAYPETEVQTWDQQAAEAEALLADTTAPAPMIRAIATALGQDPVVYAQSVKTKADAYRALGAAAVAARQAGDANIEAANTPAEVDMAVQAAVDKVTAAIQTTGVV